MQQGEGVARAGRQQAVAEVGGVVPVVDRGDAGESVLDRVARSERAHEAGIGRQRGDLDAGQGAKAGGQRRAQLW